MTRAIFHPEADLELAETARYYEDQAAGLGLEFITAVEMSCRQVVEYPEIGHPFGARMRRVLVPRFPFGVLYRVESDRIFVVAIAHLRRRPGYWRIRGT